MAQVLSNNSSFALALEQTIGVLPVAPSWRLVEPNQIPRGGAELTTVARRPISRNRQRRKGVKTDLESGWEAELDLTREHLLFFLPLAMFTAWVGPRYFVCTGVTSTGYTVAANGDLPAGFLVKPTGFRTPANNAPGTFKVVTSGSTGTEIHVSGLTAETIGTTAEALAQNALVEVCGVRGAVGDIEIDSNGNLISTTLDFTTLRLNVGEFIGVGGATANAFALAANRGTGRITSIAAHLITLDKTMTYAGVATTFVEDDGATKLIDLYFGRWARNVAVGHTDYLQSTVCVETIFTDLEAVGTPRFSYARGNLIDSIALTFQGQDKATMTVGVMGLDTQPPQLSRETNAQYPLTPTQVDAYSTAADFTRLRVTEVDESGVTSDFQDLTVTIGNNVTPEKCLGTLGNKYMNVGLFEVSGECSIVLTNVGVMEAVRSNDLMTQEIGFRNEDGSFIFDFPSVTLGNGVPEFPPDESVKLPLNIDAIQDTQYGYTMSVSCFPYLPSV